MAFKTYATSTSAGSNNKDRPSVDWDAYNNHIVEACGTATKKRSIPGVISQVIDLGVQHRPDYTEEYKGDDEEAEIAKDPSVSFFNEGGKRMLRRPQKPAQAVAIVVDFPSVTVDKGQFFGNSNPLPLRMLLNGEFSEEGPDGKRRNVVSYPYFLNLKKHDEGWGFAKNNRLHKLAEACGVLRDNGLFLPEDLDKLIGKVAQFEFRVWMKPSKKDPSRKFMTEEIKLVGQVPEGIPVPALPEGVKTGVVSLDPSETVDVDLVKSLRVSIKNTMQKSPNWMGSGVQKVLDGGSSNESHPQASAPPTQSVDADGPDDSFDGDIPF